uniref:Putative nitrate-induced NOI protein n=1 Tax=Petunia integrifolia subsp. inflata TaxID=212142 RepID=Q7X6Y5_PETIN|nr:putative nitrate-induced NOI protein [Petunia integrifolia subsp. inflata]AAQ10002.1 putative nitrate-induced NOI protein [Petunia integrifolia subsp. inflata]
MSDQRNERPLPRFGEWDVNNPAAAREFSVIFDRARNAKKDVNNDSPWKNKERETTPFTVKSDPQLRKSSSKQKWLCCGHPSYAES